MKPLSLQLRRPFLRESLIFLSFLVMTAIMTWPWLLELRSGIPDLGDPYAHSYFLWWDYHQTFHDPLNLFHATIFFPYRYSLAFGEYDYGVSLIFFPLFALGLRPLTVYSVAAFLSFPFTGYGMFRLARTLSGSEAVAWIAASILMFLPFRFHHLAHLPLIFAGWIPLLFEALVLFGRERTWPRAAYLGISFLMNGLTCTSWLILTAIPLAFSLTILLIRNQAWRDRHFWLRGVTTVTLAALMLLPFLLPLQRVAMEHGFLRSIDEVRHYSARPINWLAADVRNKVWRGFGAAGVDTEMVLFPGLTAPLLALAAFLLPGVKPRNSAEKSPVAPTIESAQERQESWSRALLTLLDMMAIFAAVTCLLAVGYGVFKLRLFGYVVLTASEPYRVLSVFVLVLLVRCSLAYPAVVRTAMNGERNLAESIRTPHRSELFGHALIWAVIGFIGSFGLNFFFHRLLYDYVPVFRGMRVATRWAMIGYVGLALLAGLGASRLVRRWQHWLPRHGQTLSYVVILVLVLVELHVAPLKLVRGEPDPDQLTLFLKAQKMAGGIVELPFGEGEHLYMLRAADHGQPLVNGISSFVPPLQQEIGRLTRSDPIPDKLFDIFESVPVSYVTVRYALLSADTRSRVENFLSRGINLGRLRFIRSFENGGGETLKKRDDLYAVIKTEPNARGESGAPRFWFQGTIFSVFSGSTGNLPISPDLMFRYYRASYGRLPTFAEFLTETKTPALLAGSDDEDRSQRFARAWIERREFISAYKRMSDEEYVAAVLDHAGLEPTASLRAGLLAELQTKKGSRADLLRKIVEDPIFVSKEVNPSFVLMSYFDHLQRDPDPEGFRFWLDYLNRSSDFDGLTKAFANAPERRTKTK